MKKFTFKGVLDGFRQTVQPQTIRQEQEIQETLRPEHFALRKVNCQHIHVYDINKCVARVTWRMQTKHWL